MLRGNAGRGQAKKSSRPNPGRGPAQPPACPAQREERGRGLEALRAQLEGERLRSQELQRRWAAERLELQEAAERERQLLADRLRSTWERQQASKRQRLQEQSRRQRDAEIRQLLQAKAAQLCQMQQQLQQRRNNTVRQAQDLLRQLAKVLLSVNCSSEAHQLRQEVQRKLCRKSSGEQAAHVLRLERELQEQRRHFLHYILEHGEGQPPTFCTGPRAAAVGPCSQQRPACHQAAAEVGVQAAEQQEACPPEHRELVALRAQLEGERLHCQELQRLWAAERCELQEAAQRERQLLADQLRCAWEKQQAQEEQQLKEWEQRQRATETQQLLRWKEAELHATQELLERECDAAQHVARKLQQLLAGVLRSPHKNSREACAMLSDILSKLGWAMDSEQPARIRQLQHQLELERRLFEQYILGSWEGEPQHVESHRTNCSQDREVGHHRAEQGSSQLPVKDTHVQVR